MRASATVGVACDLRAHQHPPSGAGCRALNRTDMPASHTGYARAGTTLRRTPSPSSAPSTAPPALSCRRFTEQRQQQQQQQQHSLLVAVTAQSRGPCACAGGCIGGASYRRSVHPVGGLHGTSACKQPHEQQCQHLNESTRFLRTTTLYYACSVQIRSLTYATIIVQPVSKQGVTAASSELV